MLSASLQWNASITASAQATTSHCAIRRHCLKIATTQNVTARLRKKSPNQNTRAANLYCLKLSKKRS